MPIIVASWLDMLKTAANLPYAVGAFSPRYTKMILPVLQAAVELHSPVIVQISEKELDRNRVVLSSFAKEFYRQAARLELKVPAALHLDHAKTPGLIRDVIACNFMSVMIDASDQVYDENVRISREIADYSHERGVFVEAELGCIGATDSAETDNSADCFTDPMEAGRFIRDARPDALAVSVGTSHGLYNGRQPNIQYDLLREIYARTGLPLVLHGGSDTPAEKLARAVREVSAGVAKVNIATDLEQAMLRTLGRKEHLTDSEVDALPPEKLELARLAVKEVVMDKMSNYLFSTGKAAPA